MRVFGTWICSIAFATALTACGGDSDGTPVTLAAAAQAQGLNDLGAAAAKAGLSTTLTDTSVNLTVFGPTDAAFDTLAVQLGFTNGAALVEALPASALSSILTYHILPARKSAADLTTGGSTQATDYSFEGTPATLAVDATSGVALTDADLTTAHVTKADVAAANGVLHVVDKVLVPPGVLNVVQMAQANPLFSSLVGAIVSVNLQDTLSGPGPFTVFAPTNDAFAAIADTVATLTPDQLTQVLEYHVLGSQVLAADIPFGTPVATLDTQTITINSGTPPTITDTTATPANIIATDVRASNGVIHVIDKVLLPSFAI